MKLSRLGIRLIWESPAVLLLSLNRMRRGIHIAIGYTLTMRRFLLALMLAAIAISPDASQAKRSDTSGRSIARSESRSHRGEARSDSTGHTDRARAVGSHRFRCCC